MSALGELGRTGLTAVGNSHEEARATYAEAVAVLDQEARAESIQRPAFAQIRRGRRNPNDEARITNESRARLFRIWSFLHPWQFELLELVSKVAQVSCSCSRS